MIIRPSKWSITVAGRPSSRRVGSSMTKRRPFHSFRERDQGRFPGLDCRPLPVRSLPALRQADDQLTGNNRGKDRTPGAEMPFLIPLHGRTIIPSYDERDPSPRPPSPVPVFVRNFKKNAPRTEPTKTFPYFLKSSNYFCGNKA